MKNKNLILFIILLAMIGLAAVYLGPLGRRTQEAKLKGNFLADIEPAEIDVIRLTSDGRTTSLNRQEDGWLVEGAGKFYVGQVNADNLINSLTEAINKPMQLASKNADKQAEFGVDEESAVKVELINDGQTEAEFLVGRNAPGYKRSYVRRLNDDETKIAVGRLYSTTKKEEWRDHSIFSFQPELADYVRIQRGNSNLILIKSEEGWRIEEGGQAAELKAESIDALVSTMAVMRADNIPEQTFAGTGLAKNNLIVQVRGEGFDKTLMLGSAKAVEDNTFYYAKPANNDNIYLINQAKYDQLDLDLSELR